MPQQQATRQLAWHTRRSLVKWVVGLPILVVLAVLLGISIASGWLPGIIMPRKIVVTGNALIPAQELIAAAKQDQTASFLTWWRAFANLGGDQVRWLNNAQPRLGWGRSLVVEVAEQRPLLRVTAPDGEFWLCEDYRLIQYAPAQDKHAVFQTIAQLPAVELEAPVSEFTAAQGEGLACAVSCLQQVMPGIFQRIKQDLNGELWCYTTEGFAVKLGAPEHLAEKTGALPKALRICAAQRRQLQYLDASDPRIFYQRWQEPPQR